MPNLRFTYLFSLALFSLLFVAAVANAQQLTGIVKGTAGEPIVNVTVSTNASRSTALTDRNGVFHLYLSPGSHVIRFRRIGFEPTQLSVQIDSSMTGGDTLRVILNPAPHELKGLLVRAERNGNMSLTLTPQTMRNAPALGETDVFRTLPLLPSISQPNDLLDIIHLAGGASDEAAITLGGHPLQAPFHAGNIFGALNVAALSQANVLMHHIPARTDGYLSGEIALVPRAVGNSGSREVVVSLLSASATVTQPIGAHHGILASARTTYLEHVVKAVSGRSASDESGIPGFRDLLVKVNGGSNAWRWDVIAYGMHNAEQEGNRVCPKAS